MNIEQMNEVLTNSGLVIEFNPGYFGDGQDEDKKYYLTQASEQGEFILDSFDTLETAYNHAISLYEQAKQNRIKTLADTILILQEQIKNVDQYDFSND